MPIKTWFYRFATLNTLLLCLQLTFILSQSGSFISALPLPFCVYRELFFTLLIQCILAFLFTCWQTSLMWGVLHYPLSPNHSNQALTLIETTPHHPRLPEPSEGSPDFSTMPNAEDPSLRSGRRMELLIGVCSWGTFLALNCAFFPLSLFSRTLFPDLPHSIAYGTLILCAIPMMILSAYTLVRAIQKRPLLTFIPIGAILWIIMPPPPVPEHKTSSKPNIIVIGIDSLSPKSINRTLTPTLATFLHQSIWFQNTISPLARTYPAWTTILTGLYPIHHHAEYNLMPPKQIKSNQSIAWLFQKAGYKTIFATDDRRFNTLNHTFGFQTIVGPKTGVNDILLGSFNDFPLSNWLINLPIGRWLFPYNHMNRASYFSYYPSTFDRAIHQALLSHDSAKPLFLAVHFTLPHWPYAFAPSTHRAVDDEYRVDHREHLYDAALIAADNQIKTLIADLSQQGKLKNSMVVLLSDHGETLYTTNSRQTNHETYQGKGKSHFEDYLLKHTSTELTKSAGHGSDLLSPDQYHCVLAFQTYNQHSNQNPRQITQNVALMDIAPTLLAYAHLNPSHPMDGLSLLPIINHPNKTPKSRTFIMESGMLPNQFLSKQKARQSGQELFTVEANHGQLQLREDKLAKLNALKLHAILSEDWILALYPTPSGYLPIIQRLSTGAWIDDLQTPFAASTPATSLLHQLTDFYHHSWPLTHSLVSSYSP